MTWRQWLVIVVCAWLIYGALDSIVEAARHSGHGAVGEDGRITSEREYKRHEYVAGGFLLLCGIGGLVLVAMSAQGKK